MTPEQWRRVNDLYHKALDLPPERRSGFVLEQSSGDGTIARELKRLLEIDPERTAVVDRGLVPEGHLAALLGTGLSAGEKIAGRYRIERELGAGGMGQVYEAFDEELNTRIALKIIRPQLASEPKVVARFKQEVQLARLVTHPNVCRAYDLVRTTHHGRELLFLCMEYVEGETLSAKLRRDGRMTLPEAEPMIEQMAAGLAAAHAAGIVHRDLKSGNIFLSKDREGALRVVIADFGLAGNLAREEGATQQTSTGWGIGTPAYMAPEQVEGGTIGPPADIYAFGVVMYEMATGHVPYEGQTPLQVAVRRLKERPRPPREMASDVDAKWEGAILRCLEVDPADRFASAGDVPPALRQSQWLPRVPRRAWRRQAGAVAALMTVAASAGVYWSRSPMPEFPAQALSWYQRGITSLYDGAWPEAEAAFSQAIKAAPAFGAAYARRAEVQIEMQRLDAARSSLLAGVGQGQFTPDQKLHYEATMAYLNRDMVKAVELLSSRVKQAAENDRVLVRLDLGGVLSRLSRWKEAMVPYEEATRVDPGNARAWIQLGRAYAGARQKNWREPFERAAALLKSYPDAGLDKDLAYHLASCANFAEAPDALELAKTAEAKTSADPVGFRLVRARLLVVKVLDRLGQQQETANLLAEVRQQAVGHNLEALLAEKFYDLGYSRSTQGKTEEASQLLREAMQLAENVGVPRTLALSRLRLAEQLGKLGSEPQVAEADRLIQKAIDETGAGELVDLRLQGKTAQMAIAVQRRETARAEKLAQEILAEALAAGQREFAISAYFRLVPLLRMRLHLREATRQAEAALALAEKDGSLAQRFAAAQQVLLCHFQSGQFERALERITSLREWVAKSFDAAQAARYQLSLDRNEALIRSEMGQAERALALIASTEEESRQTKRTAVLETARMNHCMLEAEAHRKTAVATCGELLAELNARKSPAAQVINVQRSLGQAAYWAGDFALAARLADETRAAAVRLADRNSEWVSLLTLAAARRKLGQPIAQTEQRIEEMLADFVAANGETARTPFLRRGPHREFLAEIGHPVSTN